MVPRFAPFRLDRSLTQFSFLFVSDDGEDEMALSSSTILSLVASTSLSMSSLSYPVVSMGFRTLWKEVQS